MQGSKRNEKILVDGKASVTDLPSKLLNNQVIVQSKVKPKSHALIIIFNIKNLRFKISNKLIKIHEETILKELQFSTLICIKENYK